MSRISRLFRAVSIRLRAMVAMARARRTSLACLRANRPARILVVCYGNIYRSAFVGAFLRDRLGGDVEVRSSGFHPVEGRPSPERHVEVSKLYGVELGSHRSRVISNADLSWADVIVLMDRHNWAALCAMGAPAEKLIWLGALLPGPVEVTDPYLLADADARESVARMRDLSQEFIRIVSAVRG